MSLPRHLATPRPACPQCGGACGMFVEHGVRGDFQVIHCEDVYDCCWYWVPDGAGQWPHGPSYHRESILARAGYSTAVLTERGRVTGALAGKIAAVLDEPVIDMPELLYQRIIEVGRLQPLVEIAFAIRKSRALCKCKMEHFVDYTPESGREYREEVLTPEEFTHPGNHDDRCPVGAALELIAHALG